MTSIYRTKLWKCPFRDEIIELFQKGYPVTEIREFIVKKGVPISISAVTNFKRGLESMPQGQYFGDKLKEIDKKINAIDEHTGLIKVQKTRIKEMMKDDEKRLSYETRHNIALLSQMLKDGIIMRQELGEIPKPVSISASAKFADTKFDNLERIRKKHGN